MTAEPFRTLTSRTVVLDTKNIDTDQIIPARFLTTTSREGLAEACFRDWRFAGDGSPTDHLLNRIEPQDHRILVAGDNFGCGSSREHAPWALMAYGFRAVISSSIADIFRSNALKNGLLAIEVPLELHRRLLGDPGTEAGMDLEARTLSVFGETFAFAIEPFSRRLLLDGKDSLDVLLDALPAIERFEKGAAA